MTMTRDERVFFDTVYESVFPVLVRVVYRIVHDQEQAEEICHDAFLRFHERSTTLPDLQQARYWLLRVAKNLAFNVTKRRGRERTANQRYIGESRHVASAADLPLLHDETTRLVREAVDRLPPKLREVIILKEYGDLSYPEIAATLGISVGNVKVRVHRARERLAVELEAHDVEFPQ